MTRSALTQSQQRAGKLRVAQWRASHGPGGRRLGWSSSEAASILEIPQRTLQNWKAEGFLVPTVPIEVGIPLPIYNGGDLLCARILWDLGDEGVPREVLNRVSWELHDWRAQTFALDLRRIAEWRPILAIARTLELADESGDLLTFFGEETREELDSEFGKYVLLYPLGDVAERLVSRIDEWWNKAGVREARRPPWM